MGHHHQQTEDLKGLRAAFWLNLIFTLIEFVGGLLTNSMAILSDAVHDLGDTMTIGGALYFQKLSTKTRDQRFSYGYKRFSTLSALLTSAILVISAIWILVSAVPRILAPEEVQSTGMIGLALLGLLFNGLAFFRLHKGQSLNEQAVRLHLLEDVLGWLAVLIGGAVIYLTSWFIIDPIMSVAIALYIFVNAIKNINQVSKIFLQAIPEDVDLDHIKSNLMAHQFVQDVHDMHSWSLDGTYNILTLHVVINSGLGAEELISTKKELKSMLVENDIHHITLEFETQNEPCELEDC